MRKYFLMTALALFTAMAFTSFNATDLHAAKKGKKQFQKHGCKGCHFKKKGLKAKPFPSLQDMAQLSEADFNKVVLEGRKGTAMTAKKVPADELKAIYEYVKKFK